MGRSRLEGLEESEEFLELDELSAEVVLALENLEPVEQGHLVLLFGFVQFLGVLFEVHGESVEELDEVTTDVFGQFLETVLIEGFLQFAHGGGVGLSLGVQTVNIFDEVTDGGQDVGEVLLGFRFKDAFGLLDIVVQDVHVVFITGPVAVVAHNILQDVAADLDATFGSREGKFQEISKGVLVQDIVFVETMFTAKVGASAVVEGAVIITGDGVSTRVLYQINVKKIQVNGTIRYG